MTVWCSWIRICFAIFFIASCVHAQKELLLSDEEHPFYCLESAERKGFPVRYCYCNEVDPRQLFSYHQENQTFTVDNLCLRLRQPHLVLPFLGTLKLPLLETAFVTWPCGALRQPQQGVVPQSLQFRCDGQQCCNLANLNFCVRRPFPTNPLPNPMLNFTKFQLVMLIFFSPVLILMLHGALQHTNIPELCPLSPKVTESAACQCGQSSDTVQPYPNTRSSSLNQCPSPLLRSEDLQFSALSLTSVDELADARFSDVVVPASLMALNPPELCSEDATSTADIDIPDEEKTINI